MKTLEDALAAIEAMKTDFATEKAAILKKNTELIDREKAAKKTADEAEAARDEAASEAASKTGDIESVKATYERKLTKLNADLAARDTRLNDLLINNAVSEAITANGVMPQYAKAVALMLKADAKIENGEAKADGVPLSDHIAAFFTSADAKHFVAAPANSGAGATGSTGKGTTFQKAPETAEEWEAYMKLSVDNPVEANALAAKFGIPNA